MKKITIFILWDENAGYRTSRMYLDEASANVALGEHYTQYWIDNSKAKVEKVEAVSYFSWAEG